MWQPSFLFWGSFVFNRYMFVFEVFLLLATFLVNSFDFVFLSYLWCDVLNVWYALIRVLGRPARESMFLSIPHFGGVLRSSVFTEFLYFYFLHCWVYLVKDVWRFWFFAKAWCIVERYFNLGIFFLCLSVPLSHQCGMPCWTVFLAYVTWLIFIILVFVLEIGIDSFFVTDVLTFVFHSFLCLAFYFFLVFGLLDFI